MDTTLGASLAESWVPEATTSKPNMALLLNNMRVCGGSKMVCATSVRGQKEGGTGRVEFPTYLLTTTI
jgi:hypothetical protein